MNLVREHINFERNSNPKKVMGTGIYEHHNFDNWTTLIDFIWDNLHEIAGVKDLNQIISPDREYYFKQKYYEKIEKYMEEYITFQGSTFTFGMIDADIYTRIVKGPEANAEAGIYYWDIKKHGIRIEEGLFKRNIDPTRAMRTGKYEPNPENPNDTVIILVDYNFKSKIYTMLQLLRNHYENVYIRHENTSARRWRDVIVQDSSATIEDVSDLLYKYIENKIVHAVDYDR